MLRMNGATAACHLDADQTAIGIAWPVVGTVQGRRASRQVGEAHVLPEDAAFAGQVTRAIGVTGIPRSIDAPIVHCAQVGCGRRTGRRVGGAEGIIQLPLVLVAREGLEAVLIGVDETRYAAEVADHVLDLGAVDQLLALQHAAQQQADDDEYNGDLHQGKARLLFLELVHLILLSVSTMILGTSMFRASQIQPIWRSPASNCRVFDTVVESRTGGHRSWRPLRGRTSWSFAAAPRPPCKPRAGPASGRGIRCVSRQCGLAA
jgi:hypothetical protein